MAAGWLMLTAAGAACIVPGETGLTFGVLSLLMAVAAIASGFKAWRRYRASERARARRNQLRELIAGESGGALVCRGERIVAANAAARALLPVGIPLEGSLLVSVLPGWTTDRVPATGDVEALLPGTAVALRLTRSTAFVGRNAYSVLSIRSQERYVGSWRTDDTPFWDALEQRFANRTPGLFGLLLLELTRDTQRAGPGSSPGVSDALMRRIGARLGAGPAGVRLTTRFGHDRFALLVDERSPARIHALGDSLAAVLTEWLRTEAGAPDVRARAAAALAPLDAASPGALVDAAERVLLFGAEARTAPAA